MYGFIEKTSDLKEENAIYNEVVEAGQYRGGQPWMA